MPAHDLDIVRFTNCRLSIGGSLVPRDICFSSATGLIVDEQRALYEQELRPPRTIDLGGRIVAPGFIDVQINGGWAFDFAVPAAAQEYLDGLRRMNEAIVKTGVTSYLPTLMSRGKHVYDEVLPHLRARPARDPRSFAEPLGAHCEGPFLNPEKNGVHAKGVLRRFGGMADLEAFYGAENMTPSAIRMITVAPELDAITSVVAGLASRGIVVAVGHSNATYEEMVAAVQQGATMITHLFNAISTLNHRAPGILGVLGAQHLSRPYYSIIADNVHVHPAMVGVAYRAHPDGLILVSDALCVLGMPDGEYQWNGKVVVKSGVKATLKDSGTIAGGCVPLLECVVNFLNWTGAPVAAAIRAVTETPAEMLGLQATKGSLKAGADADLVVLSEGTAADGKITLAVDEVWKFGVRVV